MSRPGSGQGALRDFWRWEDESCVEVVADVATDKKGSFMPLETLKAYFEANGGLILCQILAEVFGSNVLPIHPELILRDHTAVFCILLRIGRGRHIEQFVQYEELSDQRLPFDESHAPRYFPVSSEDPAFLRQFCDKQWTYCVPIFDSHMLHKHFGVRRLLPITHVERLGNDGSAHLYKVKIYASHNKLLPGAAKATNHVNPHVFSLKRYTKESESQYMQEINSFRSLKSQESILGLCASYVHGNDFHLLLEYADRGSLEDYFRGETPPSRGGDIIRLWEGLFKLLEALKAIHAVLGSHQGVKLTNVLVLSYGAGSPYEWKFKLADFRQDHAEIKVPPSQDRMADGDGGGLTYGAPECYLPYNLHDTQTTDIWSLGCIYSEAAIWIAEGHKGLVEYRRQRVAETDTIPDFKGGDCFHDGDRVLRAVLDAHAGIEESLRRSDYITKDVLDSLVDEMLWEEDRPGAKALLRKAEGVLSRARSRLPLSTGDDFPGPPSSSSLLVPLLRYPPPQQPLPEIPRRQPAGLPYAAERQYPLHVERWRSQVRPPQTGGSSSSLSSPVYSRGERSVAESISNLEQELNGSLSRWEIIDDNSLASPITSIGSAHSSAHYDYHRHLSTEGRPRPLQVQSQGLPEHKRPRLPPHGLSHTASENGHVPPSVAETPVEFEEDHLTLPPAYAVGDSRSVIDDPRNPADDAGTIHQSSRRSSIAFSIPAVSSMARIETLSSSTGPDNRPVSPKSHKRSEFSLFPPSKPRGFSPIPSLFRNSSRTSLHRGLPTPVSRVEAPRTLPPTSLSNLSESSPADYLSLNTVLEWKKAHKKVKKRKDVIPLPGAHLIDELSNRDHVFIIDDAASMKDCWADVTRVFDALSFVVKGMSPDGIELFYTIAYDAWRRRDPSELCTLLAKKPLDGDTDIKYRLDLQLQSYRAKLAAAPRPGTRKNKKTPPPLRPVSFYVLTNGAWAAGADPRPAIRDMAAFLLAPGAAPVAEGQVSIQFVGFSQNAAALRRMNDVAKEDFGLEMVDCTPWTENLLKMLRGPLDRRSHGDGEGEKRGRQNGHSAARVAPLAELWG